LDNGEPIKKQVFKILDPALTKVMFIPTCMDKIDLGGHDPAKPGRYTVARIA